jgi:hypothetical protein
MRKRIASVLATGGAIALTLGLTAAPAFAATWTVSPGGSITGTAATTTLKDTTSGNTLSCTSSKTTATLKKGSGLAGTGIGSVTGISFSGCTGPLGLTFTVAPGHLPWHLNAVSYNATSHVTTGTITGIHATLTGPSCSAVVDGATSGTANNGKVKVTYTNSTHKLKVLTTGGTLHIWNVSGCAGLINSGDASTFSGSYTISPAQTITSP